jgi:acetoin:2,6-dichlorophenolindophenol oxidoreductase subunit alpha
MQFDPKRALKQMMRIRAYEEKLVELQTSGSAPGTCTSVGQEAAAVGVVSALRRDDQILTNHRSASHLIARGADLGRMIAEVMGKKDGYCGGKSGSLHISVEELGVLLTSTIVGGELGLATGVGLSRSMAGDDAIVVCFFGDGAACEGRFHESLNLAAVWNLPILYVCENNQWQAYVHRRETMLIDRIADRAAGYGVEGLSIDGNDVEGVYEAARRSAAYVRETRKPFLLETCTYRLRGHYEPDDQAYVDPAELEHWRARDPIALLQSKLQASGTLDASAARAMAQDVRQEVEAAAAFAHASPYPDFAELTSDVYA